MEKPNTISIDIQDGISLMKIDGDLTSYSEPYLNDAFAQIENRPDINRLILVFDGEAYVNSGGIAALIQVLADIDQTKTCVGIVGISDHFAKIFKLVGITKLARIFGSLDEAFASMG